MRTLPVVRVRVEWSERALQDVGAIAVALREYIDRHPAGRITVALNEIFAEESPSGDAFARDASRRVLERTEW